jgi:hypothetical protein
MIRNILITLRKLLAFRCKESPQRVLKIPEGLRTLDAIAHQKNEGRAKALPRRAEIM